MLQHFIEELAADGDDGDDDDDDGDGGDEDVCDGGGDGDVL